MKTYNVKEIANMLNINEETVRRWIRSDGLRSIQTSRKTGNVVNEQDLWTFINDNPKYHKYRVLLEMHTDEGYRKQLNDLLNKLLNDRDMLDRRIKHLQSLLEES